MLSGKCLVSRLELGLSIRLSVWHLVLIVRVRVRSRGMYSNERYEITVGINCFCIFVFFNSLLGSGMICLLHCGLCLPSNDFSNLRVIACASTSSHLGATTYKVQNFGEN